MAAYPCNCAPYVLLHREWVEGECQAAAAQSQAAENPPDSFTRVVISELKPSILRMVGCLLSCWHLHLHIAIAHAVESKVLHCLLQPGACCIDSAHASAAIAVHSRSA